VEHAGQDRLEPVEHGHFARHDADLRVSKGTGDGQECPPFDQTVGIHRDDDLSCGTGEAGCQRLTFPGIHWKMNSLHQIRAISMGLVDVDSGIVGAAVIDDDDFQSIAGIFGPGTGIDSLSDHCAFVVGRNDDG
jgi:hypothetical protein